MIFTATPVSLRTLGTGPFRVITQPYVLSFKSQQIGDNRATVFQAGCPNIPFSAPFCNGITTTTGFLLIRFVRSQSLKVPPNKAKKLTIRELSRKTPASIGAKLLIASTALRAYRNRHLGTLMRCCEAWKPIEDCFDTPSFECVDFQRLSQIIANLTRETLAEREAEITNLLWTQTEKDTALARCRGGQRAWRNKKPVLPSAPMSMSNLFTFMKQDGICLIKSWKENRDGSCKVFFHVPHFVDLQ